MIDITKYVSKTKVKEVLTKVYVHEIDGVKYAVATDSFRLARVKIPNEYAEFISNGYYSDKTWKDITKNINKKTFEVLNVKILSEKEMLHQIDETYPEYQRIIPDVSEMEVFTGKLNVNADYFSELLLAIKDNFNQIDFNRINQNDTMYMYQDDETTILIMRMNK